MKNECYIVRDILPLYLEDMVSEETAAFIKEHLEHCPACAAELAAMGKETKAEAIGNNMPSLLDEEIVKPIYSLCQEAYGIHG